MAVYRPDLPLAFAETPQDPQHGHVHMAVLFKYLLSDRICEERMPTVAYYL